MEENLEKQKENQEKLKAILAQLTKDQLRFVVALQEHPSKDAAAKAIGVKVATVYNWNSALIDEAARLMALDVIESAMELRKRNLVKAMGVKAAGLDSKNEVLRQKVSTEIIEWELGKAQERVDHTTGGEKVKGFIVISPDDWDKSEEKPDV